MSRFVSDIKERLKDIKIQGCIDPIRFILNGSFEKEVVKTYERGEYLHLLIRVVNYVIATILLTSYFIKERVDYDLR